MNAYEMAEIAKVKASLRADYNFGGPIDLTSAKKVCAASTVQGHGTLTDEQIDALYVSNVGAYFSAQEQQHVRIFARALLGATK